MFWLILFLWFITGLFALSLVRKFLLQFFPQIFDWHFDVTLIILLFVALPMYIAEHHNEEVKKNTMQKELNELRNKANENTFRPFNDELRAKVKANLEELARRYAGLPIKINVGYQIGDPKKESIAFDIVDVIKASGLEAATKSISMFGRSSGKLPPMEILANPQHAQGV